MINYPKESPERHNTNSNIQSQLHFNLATLVV